MSDTLRKAIAASKSVRDGYSEEFKTAITFALLELSEVDAGIRTLDRCPGLRTVARELHKLDTRIKPADTRA